MTIAQAGDFFHSQLVNRLLVDAQGRIIGEAATISLDKSAGDGSEYTRLNLNNTYQNPVLIAAVNSNNDSDPMLVRGGGLRQTPAPALTLQEWPYQNGQHGQEQAVVTQHLRVRNNHVRIGLRNQSATTASCVHGQESISWVAIGKTSLSAYELGEASRFLAQASMGGSESDIQSVALWGEQWWLDNQRYSTARSQTEPYMNVLYERLPTVQPSHSSLIRHFPISAVLAIRTTH